MASYRAVTVPSAGATGAASATNGAGAAAEGRTEVAFGDVPLDGFVRRYG
ncbi:hypothetical protein ABZ570_29175 [Micromonospora sp. NPDC007271]